LDPADVVVYTASVTDGYFYGFNVVTICSAVADSAVDTAVRVADTCASDAITIAVVTADPTAAVGAILSALDSGQTILVHCLWCLTEPLGRSHALRIAQDISIEQVAKHREACERDRALVRQAVAVYQGW